MLRLRLMNPKEFSRYSQFSFQNFVAELSRSSGLDPKEVSAEVGEGPKVAGPADLWLVIRYHLRRIGFIWIRVDPKLKSAFGFDVYLLPKYRSRGLGKKAIQLCSAFLSKRGVSTIRICVFEHNQVARRLYASLGFKQMEFNPERRQYLLERELESVETEMTSEPAIQKTV